MGPRGGVAGLAVVGLLFTGCGRTPPESTVGALSPSAPTSGMGVPESDSDPFTYVSGDDPRLLVTPQPLRLGEPATVTGTCGPVRSRPPGQSEESYQYELAHNAWTIRLSMPLEYREGAVPDTAPPDERYRNQATVFPDPPLAPDGSFTYDFVVAGSIPLSQPVSTLVGGPEITTGWVHANCPHISESRGSFYRKGGDGRSVGAVRSRSFR